MQHTLDMSFICQFLQINPKRYQAVCYEDKVLYEFEAWTTFYLCHIHEVCENE